MDARRINPYEDLNMARGQLQYAFYENTFFINSRNLIKLFLSSNPNISEIVWSDRLPYHDYILLGHNGKALFKIKMK